MVMAGGVVVGICSGDDFNFGSVNRGGQAPKSLTTERVVVVVVIMISCKSSVEVFEWP